MLEARTFVDTLDSAKEILEKENAIFRGHYVIHDYIFVSKDKSLPFEKLFLRLRLIPVNIWNEKNVVVAIKETELMEVGKNSIVPVRKEFDTEEEERAFIEENYSETFEFVYDFEREGWQYDIGNDQVDLEDIEGHPSIEFKSNTADGLQKLLNTFNIKNTIKGPSAVEVRKILNI